MKKLLYSILALAGVVATSCTQEHIDVTYDPTKVDAPVINSVTAGVLADEEPVTINYTDVNFNHQVSLPVYTLYVAKAGQEMKDQVAISGIEFDKAEAGADGSKSVSIAAKTVNNLLVKTFAAEYDVEFSLDFQIVAAVKNEKGTAVAGTESYSNIVSVKVTPFEVKEAQPDQELFPHLYVVGSLNGWDHGNVKKESDFIYDYEGNGVYRGVVNMRKPEANVEFKLTGGDWGKDEHSMAEGPFEDEASKIDLVAGGGANINVYKKNQFYFFEFDKAALTLSKVYAFDSLGVIGVNGNWDADAAKMEYNPVYTRFYADIEVTSDCEFKVRADGGWGLNWGADAAKDGSNIAISAGKYRVYFDLNKGTLVANEGMYGKDEPGVGGGATTPEEPEQPEEPTETTYGLIGTFNGWAEPDVDLVARGDGFYVAKGVVVADVEEKDGVKENKMLVRLNDKWDDKFGFAEDNTYVQLGKNTLTAGGKDMWVNPGTYDFYFNPTSTELFVANAGEADPTLPEGSKAVKLLADVSAAGWTNCNIYGWGDLGEYGGTWPGKELSTETIDGKEYYVFSFDAYAFGKKVSVIFNNGSEQTVNIEDVVLDKDYIITLTEKDGDKWKASLNGEAPAEPVLPENATYGLCGTINSWGQDGSDVALAAHTGDWLVAKAVALAAKSEIKVRVNNDWPFNYGAASEIDKPFAVTVGEKLTLVLNGKNLLVEAEGSYDVYFNKTSLEFYVVAAGAEDPTTAPSEGTEDNEDNKDAEEQDPETYGICGTMNSWGEAGADLAMTAQNAY